MSNEELAVRVASLKVISDYTKARYDEARAEADQAMNAGDRLMARSPIDSAKIAPVVKTDPKPVARVTDEGHLTAWMAENYPEKVKAGYEVIGGDDEVIGVLFDHAPHLLRRKTVIKPEDLAELRRDSAAMGCPVGPGGEVDIPGLVVETPAPVVSCKPDPQTALPAVMQLFRAGRLELDGTVRPELTAPEDTSAA